eukprot:TRINITY_DN2329_c0_g1_i2.p1 TRINITY_DN2329_c0_g1~~TRINITY_DN2329_c0_g1_i2.p1  ORF type:complete len:127 (-),score=32.68 TRINITY_DN2329_c0_g1_i2:54-434(-)
MADDSDLEAIRAKRMAELQSQLGGGGGSNPQMQQQEMERKRQMEEARAGMLSQIMQQDARERLSRIAMVKPEKARAVEDIMIRSAQTGRLSEKIDEKKLIQLLEQLNENKKETKVTITRRRFDDDD